MRHISVNIHAHDVTSCTWLSRETANTKCFWIWSNSPNLIPANFFFSAILYVHTVSMVSFQPCQLYEAVLRISSLKISKGQNIFLSYVWLFSVLALMCNVDSLMHHICSGVTLQRRKTLHNRQVTLTLLYHEEISGLVNMLCTQLSTSLA